MKTLQLWVILLFIWLVHILVPVQSAAMREDHIVEKRSSNKCNMRHGYRLIIGKKSCENHRCDHGKCSANNCLYSVKGPGQQRYRCHCDEGYTGTFCGAKREDRCKKCADDTKCYMAGHKYLTGYYCKKGWRTTNHEDNFIYGKN